MYAPDPASQNIATIGGNIAENSGGMRGVKYGTTKDHVLGFEVVYPQEMLLLPKLKLPSGIEIDFTYYFYGIGTLG